MYDIESDIQRIEKIARRGMQESTEDDANNLRLDNFVIAANMAWTDEDGIEREGTAVWSEARRNYSKVGILHGALDTLNQTYD